MSVDGESGQAVVGLGGKWQCKVMGSCEIFGSRQKQLWHVFSRASLVDWWRFMKMWAACHSENGGDTYSVVKW